MRGITWVERVPGVAALLLIPALTGVLLAGCNSDACSADDQCGLGELCFKGTCHQQCLEDRNCSGDQVCSNEVCVDPLPDASVDDAEPMPDGATQTDAAPDTDSGVADVDGGVDGGADAGDAELFDMALSDMAAGDMSIGDMAINDMALEDAQVSDAGDLADADPEAQDAMPMDGGESADGALPTPELAGVYAVTRTVLLSDVEALPPGHVMFHTARLDPVEQAGQYRMTLLDPGGIPLAVVEPLSITLEPEADRYTLRYQVAVEVEEMGCSASRERAESGALEFGEAGLTWAGEETDILRFDGAACERADQRVLWETLWRPL